jgi:PAS domain S-box-containing protein
MPADFSADVKRLAALLGRKPLRAEEIIERLERFDAAVLIADDDARYVAANTQATTLTGYSMPELLTMSVPDLTPVPNTSEFRGLWQDFIRIGEQKGTYQLRRKDGVVRTVRYAAWAGVAPGRHLTALIADGP